LWWPADRTCVVGHERSRSGETSVVVVAVVIVEVVVVVTFVVVSEMLVEGVIEEV